MINSIWENIIMPRKQEYEYRYSQIEDKQEEHHSQTVDDLRYRQIVVVVILDFRFPTTSSRVAPRRLLTD